jgi:predicted O-methyltransferase YrrM
MRMHNKFERHFSGVTDLAREGHTYLTDKTVRNFQGVLDLTGAKTIFEVGFNAGHSSFLFLQLDTELSLHSVDNARHHYTEACMVKMKEIFPDRFTYEVLDSNTLEELGEYDLAFIDGDHHIDSLQHDYNLCRDNGVQWILVDDVDNETIRSFLTAVDKDTSGKNPYNIVEYYQYENEIQFRRPMSHPAQQVTTMVLLQREDSEEDGED